MRLSDDDKVFLKELFEFGSIAREMDKKGISVFSSNFFYYLDNVTGTKISQSDEFFRQQSTESDYLHFGESIVTIDGKRFKSVVIFDSNYNHEHMCFSFEDDAITVYMVQDDMENCMVHSTIENSSDFFNISLLSKTSLEYEDLLFIKELFKTINDPVELRYAPGEQKLYGWSR